jgi:hypothetical protein
MKTYDIFKDWCGLFEIEIRTNNEYTRYTNLTFDALWEIEQTLIEQGYTDITPDFNGEEDY